MSPVANLSMPADSDTHFGAIVQALKELCPSGAVRPFN